MDRNLNNGSFERILKENADQYRMYPSEKVWKGIFSQLHTGKKWFRLGTILLLISGTFVTLVMIQSPNQKTSVPANQTFLSNPALKESESITTINKAPLSLNTKKLISVNHKQSATIKIFTGSEENRLFVDYLSPIQTIIPEYSKIDEPFIAQITDELTDQDNYYKNEKPTIPEVLEYENVIAKAETYPLSIESVINTFNRSRKSRFSIQLYFTPTISYRKLSENKAFLRTAPLSNVPYSYAALYDINNVVTHKPDMGLELGFNGRYAVSNGFKLRAGLQFNINRYDIKAFTYPIEVATIALNNGPSGARSFKTISSYRNFNGNQPDWLQNFYFQVSTPIGVEVKLKGDENVQFGVASTLQPTYVLGDRAYLLSTDYKNYAEVPWLIRRWNLNTNLETFVAYSTGKLNWQVGPQVRYQLLSSFIHKYPVKENLFDFGLKVGVSFNNQ